MLSKQDIFSPDRPITKKDEDLLQRKRFSEELANSIFDCREKDSLVLAIYGKWGDGKSSVKNMIKESLEGQISDNWISILEFNPYEWGNSEKLTKAFFLELSNLLKSSVNKKMQKIAEKLEDYFKYLESINENIFQKQLFGFPLKLLNRKNVELATLEEKKDALKKDLSNIDRTIIIMIDDIDRLSKNETKSLFKLIKSNADFPNTVYLTFFQRDIVEKSLKEEGVYEGSDYLKKIIQVGFELPCIPKNQIHSILYKKLDELIAEYNINRFDSHRWKTVFVSSLGEYFNNLRDVYRFISTLSFHTNALRNKESIDVNFVDLVSLEVLRQFEPLIYKNIFKHKKVFTSKLPDSRNDFIRERYKKIVEETIKLSHQNNQEVIKGFFDTLFPNVGWSYSNSYDSTSDSEDMYRKLRICHPDIFDRYFLLYLPEGDISNSEFNYFLSITKNKGDIISYLKDLKRRGILESFITKFENYKQQVSKEDAIPFISSLMEIGDDLSDESGEGSYISPVYHVRRIIHWYFKEQNFGSEKKQIFIKALKDTKGLYLGLRSIQDEIERREENRYSDLYIFTSQDFDCLKNIAKIKIEKALKNSEKLFNMRHIGQILFMWKDLVKELSMQIWLDKQLDSDEKILSFLEKLVSKEFVYSGNKTKVKDRLDHEFLSVFFKDLNALYNRIDSFSKRASENQKKVIKALLQSKD
ncbi:MAG: hypothetical protein GDA46_04280 [Bdellovibrionales bacterium]|nr:hypothetical protein [Bdellovibrionales bacterium]